MRKLLLYLLILAVIPACSQLTQELDPEINLPILESVEFTFPGQQFFPSPDNPNAIPTYDMISGQSITIETTSQPLSAAVHFYWMSDHPEIVSVDNTGTLSAISPGEAEITVYTADQLVQMGRFIISVTAAVESFEIAGTEHAVYVGHQTAAQVLIVPPTANQTVRWSSEDPLVARVSTTGLITGVSAGSATLTASSPTQPDMKDKIVVTVYPAFEGVSQVSAEQLGHTIQLNWTNPTHPQFGGVVVRRSNRSFPTSQTEGDAVGTTHETTLKDPNIILGRTYFYSIFTIDKSGTQEVDRYLSFTPVAANMPTPPTQFLASREAGAVQLSWETESDQAQVVVVRSDTEISGNLSDYDPIYSGTDASYLDTSALAHTAYYYGIARQIENGNYSPFASVFTDIQDLVPPAQPIQFKTLSTESEVSLSWVNPSDSDFAGVMVRRSETDFPATQFDGQLVYQGLETTATDFEVINGTRYFYSLFSHDESGNYSDPLTLIVRPQDTTAPPQVSQFDVASQNGRIEINWVIDDADIDQVLLWRITGDDEFTDNLLPLYSGTDQAYTDTAVQNNWSYTYRIQTEDTAGNRSLTTIEKTAIPVDLTPPDPVTDVTSLAGDQSVTLFWTSPSQADYAGVEIRRSTLGAPSSRTDGVEVYSGPQTSFTDTGLQNGVKTYYALFAYDNDQNYSSARLKFETPQAPTQNHDTYRLIFHVDPTLISSGLEPSRLSEYVDDINTVFAKNTSIQFSYTPANHFKPAFSNPHDEIKPLSPAQQKTLWIVLAKSQATESSGGRLSYDSSGIQVIDSLEWPEIYDPTLLQDLSQEMMDYFTQLDQLLAHLAQSFGAGVIPYDAYINLDDTTADMTTDLTLYPTASNYWSDRSDWLADPLLANAQDRFILGSPFYGKFSRSDVTQVIQFSALSAAVMTQAYNDFHDTGLTQILPDMSQIHLSITDQSTGLPVVGATVEILQVSTDSSFQPLLLASGTASSGQFTFDWSQAAFNTFQSAILCKVSATGYTDSETFLTLHDGLTEFLINNQSTWTIGIELN